MKLSVDFFLNILKLNVVLLNVDVTVSEESANLLHIGWSHPVVAVSSSHSLRESNERLKLSNSHFIGSLVLGLLSLSDSFVLFFEDLSRFLGELWVDGSAELNVSLNLLHLELRVAGIIL